MKRPTLLLTPAIVIAAFALVASLPAVAGKMVSVTVQTQFQTPLQILGADAVCSGWTAGTDANTGGPTLTCIPVNNAGAPAGCVATVNGTSSVTLPNSGGSVSLASSCSSPTTGLTYNWTKNGASSANSASWSDTLATNTSTTIASTTSYQVSICAGSACVTVPQTPLTVIVAAAPAPSGTPTGCVATINGGSNASLPSSGGSVNLAANCSGPNSGVTYNWTGNGASASNAANWTDAPPANASTTTTSTTTYQVQACNGAACVTLAPVTATRAAAPTTSGWNGTCSGFDATRLIVMDWNNPTRMLTRNFGGFNPNDAIVVQFTTGSLSTTNNLPHITAVEYGSAPSARQGVLSATPCDFSPQPVVGATSYGNTITALFAIGTGSGFGYYPVLQANTTYYLNIKNGPNPTCAVNSSCDMSIDLIKASGL